MGLAKKALALAAAKKGFEIFQRRRRGGAARTTARPAPRPGMRTRPVR